MLPSQTGIAQTQAQQKQGCKESIDISC